ncbi:MAG: nitroreductase family protein [Duncaniella sp.]|nr:nitroreductase family protein [Duncaniella sp.]MDE5734149.1 nitroreductase family protein [Duncaniella sp.]
MKSVEETILGRRSVRRYERESVTKEQMDLICEAIRNTPTSYNGQQFSVVDVTDPQTKLRLYELIGQKQIKTCSHFLVFLADYNKISLAAEAKGLEMPAFSNTADGLIVATVDATLAMSNALTMAVSLGLGCCPIGYARTAAPEAVSQVLGLPVGTYVVCGLSIGVPREYPDLKPKQPVDLVVFKDRYPADREGMASSLMAYDEVIREYNETRSGTKTDNDWVSHILGYYREAMDFGMLRALQRRGFNPTR